MNQLIDYGKKVGKHWVALLGCAAVVVYQVLVSIIPGNESSDWWKRPMPPWLNLTLLLCAFSVAQFQAWLELKKERDALVQERERERLSPIGPKIDGDIAIEYSMRAFGYVEGSHCHILKCFIRINQPMIKLVLICRHPLRRVVSFLEEYQAPDESIHFFTEEQRKGSVAEVIFPNERIAVGALVSVELSSVETVEILRIEGVRKQADPAPSKASEQSPPS